MIGAMLATDARAAASTWRPQEFGAKRAADIRDPLIEPLWNGLRVLAFVTGGEARFMDVYGDDVPGHEDVAAQLAAASAAATLLIEGVLTPEPLRSTMDVAMRERVGPPGPAKTMTTMVVGDRGDRKDRLADRAEEARLRSENPAGPVAFVAVDLLWLDDQSLCDVPLLERRRVLESVLAESELVRVGVFIKPPIDSWLGAWRSFGFTKVTFKAANSRYLPGQPNRDWGVADIPRR
jgi:ATP-dependent DNA ligase